MINKMTSGVIKVSLIFSPKHGIIKKKKYFHIAVEDHMTIPVSELCNTVADHIAAVRPAVSLKAATRVQVSS